MTDLKQCLRCKSWFPHFYFPEATSKGKKYRRGICRSCLAEYYAKVAKERKQQRRALWKEFLQWRKQRVV